MNKRLQAHKALLVETTDTEWADLLWNAPDLAIRLRNLLVAMDSGLDTQLERFDEAKRFLAAHAIDGKVTLEVWQRDCDMAEWTEKHVIDAIPEIYFAFAERLSREAEGPIRIRVLTPAETAEWEPSERDRAMEAFENGRGMSINL